ncbi:hypothetical protein SAMN05421639_101965 [Chryseobacterium shigense]|uniref:Uncharacterized protein n=1 Tax=Chryseobacterium shigense TaxID=297244 RepID=A0A1N7I0I9_9FLAO|nr:hypothetical protein [Chryseobacterium shigense]SIS30580.1 hypothetical protein SAMN05421639_101965 [Chryseobacterium shigense]
MKNKILFPLFHATSTFTPGISSLPHYFSSTSGDLLPSFYKKYQETTSCISFSRSWSFHPGKRPDYV